jgi:hypothetical protein
VCAPGVEALVTNLIAGLLVTVIVTSGTHVWGKVRARVLRAKSEIKRARILAALHDVDDEVAC